MEIPYQELSDEALKGLIEEFGTRDGASLGGFETPLSTKVKLVNDQLIQGKVVITYDEKTESCNINPK